MNPRFPLFICALALAGCSHSDDAEEKPKPLVSVKTAAAEVADIRLVVKAPASLFPREQANISARVNAPIRSITAKKGDSVGANQVLAVLESRDVAAARQEAEAALHDAEANLQKLESGTLPADIEKARGDVENAQATLGQAQKIYDRRSELFKEGAIPGRDLLQSETDLTKAKAAYEVAKRSLDLLRQQSAEKDLAMARSRVEQARARLAGANAQLQYTELRSPFAGTITDQMQYPGDMAGPGTPTFTIMDLGSMNARAQVTETDVARIKPGQACQFTPADSAIAPAPGKVTVMNRAVDPQRRTVEVWCEAANPGQRLRANIFGDVWFSVGTARGVTVPQSAVVFSEGSRSGTVMVVDSKHIAHQREIEASTVADGKVQIAKGINPGDQVIVEGGYGLPDGVEVTLGAGK
jgi:HlyD family secretion protein